VPSNTITGTTSDQERDPIAKSTTLFDAIRFRIPALGAVHLPIGTRSWRGYDRIVKRTLAWWLGIGLGVGAARIVSRFGYLSRGWAAVAWWVAIATIFSFVTVSVATIVEQFFPSRRRQRRAPADQYR
jgi:hypothetical protein